MKGFGLIQKFLDNIQQRYNHLESLLHKHITDDDRKKHEVTEFSMNNNGIYYTILTHDFCIEDADYNYDAYMQPLDTPSQFNGYVYNEEGIGLSGANISIWGDAVDSESTTTWINMYTYTDPSGYFQIDMPNGNFWANVYIADYSFPGQHAFMLNDDINSYNFILNRKYSIKYIKKYLHKFKMC